MNKPINHRHFLEEAYKEAMKAEERDQIPVGAIIVNEKEEIIARAYNQVNLLKDRTAHAEMLAIKYALTHYNGEYAPKWTIYVTLEPCPMCLGTIIMSHIGMVVWGAPDIHINTHKILEAIPYLQTRNLKILKHPYPDLEKKSLYIHNTYWIKKGRTDVVEPINEVNAPTDS